VLKTLTDNFFDMIYIDADHSYEGVYNDLKISYTKLKTGGILCGHDYNITLYPQIVAAVGDFCKEYNLKINYLSKDRLPSFGIIKT
jgi:predicted O-methyltransferase YrrM